jgi:pyruvate kinase
VANAVLDGADAVMLSGETAVGEYPVEAALAATRISVHAEERGARFLASSPACVHSDESSATAHAAVALAARHADVEAVACFTRTGRTPLLISRERPPVPIYAFSTDPGTTRRVCLLWGVTPLPARQPTDTDDMIRAMDEGLRRTGVFSEGRAVAMVAPAPLGSAPTNLLKVHRLGAPVD